MMNPDIKNKIHADRIDVEKFEQDLLNVLSPLLIEIEEYPAPLSWTQFQGAMDNLMECLNPGDRRVVLRQRKQT